MYNDCGLDISKMSSFKRFLIVAQKTSKATFNAARSAIKTTMEQNRQRAETQEQQRVSFRILIFRFSLMRYLRTSRHFLR